MDSSLRIARLVCDIIIGFCIGWNIDVVIAWIKGKRRIKRSPDSKETNAASKIKEAAKSMNMSVEELIAFYEQHDTAYAAKLRELATSGKSAPKDQYQDC